MADFTHEALKDEIVIDPEGLGYKNAGDHWTGGTNPAKSFEEIADLLNLKNLVVDRDEIPQETVRKTVALDFEGYNALSIDEQEYIRWLTPGEGSLVVTSDLKEQLSGRIAAVNGVAGSGSNNASWWSVGTRGTLAPAFLAEIETAGSRAEVLWGHGQLITPNQVVAALNIVEAGG